MQPTDRSELGEYLNHLGFVGFGAEIGVEAGLNALNILDTWKGIGMFLIDPYDLSKCGTYIDGSANIEFEQAYKDTLHNLQDHSSRYILIKETSDVAFPLLPSLDFVYIDGNHHNPQITRDLYNYWSLLRPGGLLCGHDYYDLDEPHYRCEVKASVDAFVESHPGHFFTTPCTSWYLRKPNATIPFHEPFNISASFYDEP